MQAKFVGRWVPSGNSMTTGYSGSSFSFRVSGTNYVNVSISGATRIAYKVDDGVYVVTNNVQITGLTLSTHKIKIVIATSQNTWLGSNYAQVTGIEVGSNGTILIDTPTKRKCLVFGDSITEGWMANGKSVSAPECSWWNKLSEKLNIDTVPVGIGGIGYINKSNGNYPGVKNIPSYIENITSSSIVSDTDYDLVIIELGTNDWKSRTEVDNDYVAVVTACVNRIKAKYPNADIHAIIPFNFNGQPSLNQAYGDTNVNIIPTSWYSGISFADSLHPNEAGSVTIANNLYSYFIDKYGINYFKEVVMKRIDTVYIDTNGAVQKATGTMADNPVKPTLPLGAIRVADVVVEQGASTGTVVDNRDWLKVYDNLNIVNVKDYGAVGDGVTDDTSAIQKAIDNNPGKTIYFPDGEYLISSSIVTSSTDEDKSILNLGNATIKASDSFQSEAYMIELGRKGGPRYGWSGAPRRSGVMGGRLNGNKAAYGGIHVTHMDNAFLDSVYIEAVQQIGISVEEPSLECNSSAADLKHVFVTGSGKKGSVGIKLNGCDNKLTHIKVFAFETGMEINGGGDYINICHVLGWLAYEDKNDIGFILNGGDIHLDSCYSDGFSTVLYQDGNCKRGLINNIFVLFNSNLSGANETFLKVKTGRPKISVVRANVHFNTANNPTVYDGDLNLSSDTNNNHVFYQCSFKNANLTDKGIISPLSKDPFLDPYLLGDLDLNNVLCDARFSLKLDGSQAAKKHYPVTSGVYYGMLEVKTYPNGYNVWGSCVQTIYTSIGTKYERISFSQVLGDTWTPWKTIY